MALCHICKTTTPQNPKPSLVFMGVALTIPPRCFECSTRLPAGKCVRCLERVAKPADMLTTMNTGTIRVESNGLCWKCREEWQTARAAKDEQILEKRRLRREGRKLKAARGGRGGHEGRRGRGDLP